MLTVLAEDVDEFSVSHKHPGAKSDAGWSLLLKYHYYHYQSSDEEGEQGKGGGGSSCTTGWKDRTGRTQTACLTLSLLISDPDETKRMLSGGWEVWEYPLYSLLIQLIYVKKETELLVAAKLPGKRGLFCREVYLYHTSRLQSGTLQRLQVRAAS